MEEESMEIKRCIYRPPFPLKKPRKFVKRGCPAYKRPSVVKVFTEEDIDEYCNKHIITEGKVG